MKADRIIIRTVYPEVPPHAEYQLSDLGESMRVWGENYLLKHK